MNKKAMLYAFMLGVIGLTMTLFHLLAERDARMSNTELVMGQRGFEILMGSLLSDYERAWFDVAFMHTALQATQKVARQGGYWTKPCGAIEPPPNLGSAANIWYDLGKECIPAEADVLKSIESGMELIGFTMYGDNWGLDKIKFGSRDFVYYAAQASNDLISVETYGARPYTRRINCVLKTPGTWAKSGITLDNVCGISSVRLSSSMKIPFPFSDFEEAATIVKELSDKCNSRAGNEQVDPVGCAVAESAKYSRWLLTDASSSDDTAANRASLILHRDTGFVLPEGGKIHIRIGIRLRKAIVKSAAEAKDQQTTLQPEAATGQPETEQPTPPEKMCMNDPYCPTGLEELDNDTPGCGCEDNQVCCIRSTS